MYRCSLSFLALCFTVGLSFGDIFVLRSGDRIDGTIVREDDQTLTIKPYLSEAAPVSLARIDLQEFLPDSAETLEFLALRKEADIKTALSPEVFAQLLDRRIPAFKTKYPNSRFRSELDRLGAAVQADRTSAMAGSVKIAGLWLKQGQVDPEKYQVNAAMSLEAMESASARGDRPAALNAFENIRLRYPASRAYIYSIGSAMELMKQLRRIEIHACQDFRLQLLQTGLALQELPEQARQDLLTAHRREKDQIDATIVEQKEHGVRWPAVLPHSENGFEEIVRQIDEELTALRSLPIEKYRQSIDLAIHAIRTLDAQDVAGARSLLGQARAAWPENEMLNSIAASIERADNPARDAGQTDPRPRNAFLDLPQQYEKGFLIGITTLVLFGIVWLVRRRIIRMRKRSVLLRN
jgi:hypothetical protein